MAVWLQQDAALKVRGRIRRAVEDPARVTTSLPKGWTIRQGPWVTVVSDGTPISGKGNTLETVRVTVHAKDLPTARRIMTSIDGLLLSPINVLGMGIRAGAGIIAGPDSRVGGAYASATYQVATHRKDKE